MKVCQNSPQITRIDTDLKEYNWLSIYIICVNLRNLWWIGFLTHLH